MHQTRSTMRVVVCLSSTAHGLSRACILDKKRATNTALEAFFTYILIDQRGSSGNGSIGARISGRSYQGNSPSMTMPTYLSRRHAFTNSAVSENSVDLYPTTVKGHLSGWNVIRIIRRFFADKASHTRLLT